MIAPDRPRGVIRLERGNNGTALPHCTPRQVRVACSMLKTMPSVSLAVTLFNVLLKLYARAGPMHPNETWRRKAVSRDEHGEDLAPTAVDTPPRCRRSLRQRSHRGFDDNSHGPRALAFQGRLMLNLLIMDEYGPGDGRGFRGYLRGHVRL